MKSLEKPGKTSQKCLQLASTAHVSIFLDVTPCWIFVTTTLNIGYSYEPLYERDDVEKLMSLLLETKELTILSGSQVHTGK